MNRTHTNDSGIRYAGPYASSCWHQCHTLNQLTTKLIRQQAGQRPRAGAAPQRRKRPGVRGVKPR